MCACVCIYIKHSIEKQQNTHSFQVHMEHCLGQITCQANKTSLNTFTKTRIISSIFSDHSAETRSQLQEKTAKKHKHVEPKQYATKQPIGHWDNQRENQNISEDKLKMETQ